MKLNEKLNLSVMGEDEMKSVEGGSLLIAAGLILVGLLVTSCSENKSTVEINIHSDVSKTATTTESDSTNVNVSPTVELK